MALDFPSSPTVGQQYGGYVFDGTKWKVSTTSTAPAAVQPTPPTNPTVGDMWFNSTDGTMYFYYNDGSTAQWVESRAPIVANGYYSPNYIINGGFDVWQRGASQTTSGYGSADRWYNVISGTTTISLESSDLPSVAGIRYGIKFVTGASSSFGQFFTALENANVLPLRGKTMTLSAYVKVAGSYAGNWQMKVYSSNSVDSPLSSVNSQIGATQNIATSATTSWTRVSYTFTVPSDAIGLKIEFSPDTAQPSGVTLRMAGVQLEEGSAATTFRRNANSIEGELAACQRYFYTSANQPSAPTGFWQGSLAFSTDNYRRTWLPAPVSLRRVPTTSDVSFTFNTGTPGSDGYRKEGFRAYTNCGNTTTEAYVTDYQVNVEL